MARSSLPSPHDIVIGEKISTDRPSLFPRRKEMLFLTPAQQAYHATIIGRSGSGKSRLLAAMFLAHLDKGRGICLIEPHHDLSFSILQFLVARGWVNRPDAFEKLLYLDFGNGSFVPSNVLAAKQPPKTIALQTLTAMVRLWPELRRAPAFQTLWLSGVTCLVENGLPLTCLYQLFTDEQFRRQCLSQVSDPLIHQALTRFANGSAQDAASLLRRAFLLSFNDVMRLSLSQPDLLLDFRTLMDRGTSVILNLGNVADAETRRILAALLLVQIEQAALSRTDIPEAERRPYTVLLDEWPSYGATDDTLSDILEQTRKFGLRLYLAAQSLGQISSDLLDGALENCRLTIAFGLGRSSAVKEARQLVTPVPPPSPSFWNPVSSPPPPRSTREQFEALSEDLQILDTQLAYVKLHTAAPIKIRTLTVADAHPEQHLLDQVLSTYKSRYQISRERAEAAGRAQLAHFAAMPSLSPTFSEDNPFAAPYPFA